MLTPAVMFIEMAVDMLKSMTPEERNAQLKEFLFMGNTQLIDALKLQGLAPDPLTRDDVGFMSVGFLIGITTARALLASNPKAVEAGIEL